MKGKLIFGLIFFGLAVLFIIQNASIISIHFIFWTLSMSGALLFFLILILGAVLGWLLHSYAIHNKEAPKRP